jgi:hypothetical protein
MGLRFGAATSDRVVFTALPVQIDPISIIVVVRLTTLTDTRRFISKNNAGTGVGLRWLISGSSGETQIRVSRATTSLSYITNTAPAAQLGRLLTIGMSFDSAATAGALCQVWSRYDDRKMAAATFGTATDGSGAISDTSAEIWHFANAPANNLAMQGDGHRMAIYNRVLGLDEWTRAANDPTSVRGLTFLAHPGMDGGAYVAEEIGRQHGTVTGAVLCPAEPLVVPPALPWEFDVEEQAAAPAASSAARTDRRRRGTAVRRSRRR